MDRLLRPERFEGLDDTTPAQWNHWFCTFSNFTETLSADQTTDRLKLLINHVGPTVYGHISECTTYEEAISVLKSVYVKPSNEIFARHQLSTRKQQPGESIDNFLLSLKQMSKDCNFTAVSAETHRQQAIRDAFISGLSSSLIRQRLLENHMLTLDDAVGQARSLDLAQRNAEVYASSGSSSSFSAAALTPSGGSRPAVSCPVPLLEDLGNPPTVAVSEAVCYFCGRQNHPRFKCPAKNVTCLKCSKKGHFASVCRSSGGASARATQSRNASAAEMLSSMTSASASTLSRCSNVSIDVNGQRVTAMVDSGSTNSFIRPEVAEQLGLTCEHSSERVSMASSPLMATTQGHCLVNLKVCDLSYKLFKLSLLPNLCSEVILGQDFMKMHECVQFDTRGDLPKLTVCGVAAMKLDPPSLFANLSPDCHPIATPSRRYSQTDRNFIRDEVQKLLQEGIIEKSNSPWRAQVLVTSDERHKRRMVVDYSCTINKYTLLDAYPIPRVNNIIQDMSQYHVFSKLDLKSAYHQVPLREDEKAYTAFEADGQLLQFTRIPFGLTNAVAGFQRTMDSIITDSGLKGTYAYIDDVIVCGKDKAEHDLNLARFKEVTAQYSLTLNESKCQYGLTEISYLGYQLSNGTLRPDPDRLQPLRDLPLPSDTASLRRTLGLLSYYSQWIPNYSSRIAPLLSIASFPAGPEAKACFDTLKEDICEASVAALDDRLPLEVETDASATTLAATLSQNGRPVAFFSRTLSKTERLHPAVEREACAIIEAIRKWRQILIGRHFKIITDQQAVSFMFKRDHGSRIKNDKIMRWRLELTDYQYDIQYRPGKDNLSADALSRACSTSVNPASLEELHRSLCHPGVTRLLHFVKSKNLPFSLDDVKRVTAHCSTCAELKPRFYKPPASHLVHATRPMDRLSVDFVGPKPSVTRNRYLLVLVDEYSRFPFAYPCADMSSQTVINCFLKLFSVFGCPSSVHSDRGSQFMSREVSQFLSSHGVIMTHSTPYHPQGNGQCERMNGNIWKGVRLTLHSRKLPETQWESVLDTVLHSLRSLLCTATNETPHERLFSYPRKSSSGYSLPTWLSSPGPVLLRKFVRESKADALVQPVDLLSATPHYARVRFPDGRESTVSTKDIAPSGGGPNTPCEGSNVDQDRDSPVGSVPEPVVTDFEGVKGPPGHQKHPSDAAVPSRGPVLSSPDLEARPSSPLRRSSRVRVPPKRLIQEM